MSILKKIFLRSLGKLIPSDILAWRYPVSIKGILTHNQKILLLKNERQEWDLPGGKLFKKETIENCLLREFKEETNLDIKVEEIIDATVYNVMQKIEVVVIVYQCKILSDFSMINISSEHTDYGFFSKIELDHINLVPEYKKIITQSLNDY